MKALPCAVQRACGGCPSMPLSLDEERRTKLARVQHAVAVPLPVGWVSEDRLAYRRRMRLRVDDDGRPSFFNEVKNDGCVVLTPSLTEAVAVVRDLRLPGAHHVEVREADLDGYCGLHITSGDRSAQMPSPPSAFRIAVDDAMDVVQRFAITDDVWSLVPPNAFLQVNASINRRLVRSLIRGARSRSVRRFFDPYAGAGNHALALAAAGMTGIAGDVHRGAVRGMQASARAQGLALGVCEGPAKETAEGVEAIDLLVANPPRAGLRDAAVGLAAVGAPHVALVHCTPTGLQRDLAVFRAKGYRVTEVVAFNMFPHTDHVESLTWLMDVSCAT